MPVVVSSETGVRVGVRHGITGFHAEDLNSITHSVLHLMKSDAARREMSGAAREFACSKTWCCVFEQLYRTYQTGLETIGLAASGAHGATEAEYVGQGSGIGHDDHPAGTFTLD